MLAGHDDTSWRWQRGQPSPAPRQCNSAVPAIPALGMHSATHLRWTPAWGLRSGLFGSWPPCRSAVPSLSLRFCLCVYAHGPGVTASGCATPRGEGRPGPHSRHYPGAPLACRSMCRWLSLTNDTANHAPGALHNRVLGPHSPVTCVTGRAGTRCSGNALSKSNSLVLFSKWVWLKHKSSESFHAVFPVTDNTDTEE